MLTCSNIICRTKPVRCSVAGPTAALTVKDLHSTALKASLTVELNAPDSLWDHQAFIYRFIYLVSGKFVSHQTASDTVVTRENVACLSGIYCHVLKIDKSSCSVCFLFLSLRFICTD